MYIMYMYIADHMACDIIQCKQNRTSSDKFFVVHIKLYGDVFNAYLHVQAYNNTFNILVAYTCLKMHDDFKFIQLTSYIGLAIESSILHTEPALHCLLGTRPLIWKLWSHHHLTGYHGDQTLAEYWHQPSKIHFSLFPEKTAVSA